MRLFVPACGDRIQLSKDWHFDLYFESRNNALLEKAGVNLRGMGWRERQHSEENRNLRCVAYVLPAGTILEVDRVYIRTFSKNAETKDDDYDSLTFRILGSDKARFWAKLADVNTIEFDFPSAEAVEGVDRAKSQAKQAKETLDAIKDYAMSRCSGLANDPLSPHVDAIVERISRTHFKRGSWMSNFKPEKHDVRRCMEGRVNRWSAGNWAATKTEKRPDGTTLRHLRFSYYNVKFGGFVIVSRGTEVLSCEPLD